jgi:FlaG/FlaF family flagellin (archaellin)
MWKKMKKDVEALSPVVATLLIILVTVGAVSALYIW